MRENLKIPQTYGIPYHNNCLLPEFVVALSFLPPQDDNVPVANKASGACKPEPAILR